MLLGLDVEKESPTPTNSLNSQSSQLQDHLYRMPAMTSLPYSPIASGVGTAHVFWTKITPAGITLSIPTASCRSVSLFSQKQAEKWLKLDTTLFSRRWASTSIFLLQIPPLPSLLLEQCEFQWSGKMLVFPTFVLLVVPDLVWPILFSQTHLEATEARVSSQKAFFLFSWSDLGFSVNYLQYQSIIRPLTLFVWLPQSRVHFEVSG